MTQSTNAANQSIIHSSLSVPAFHKPTFLCLNPSIHSDIGKMKQQQQNTYKFVHLLPVKRSCKEHSVKVRKQTNKKEQEQNSNNNFKIIKFTKDKNEINKTNKNTTHNKSNLKRIKLKISNQKNQYKIEFKKYENKILADIDHESQREINLMGYTLHGKNKRRLQTDPCVIIHRLRKLPCNLTNTR